MMKPTKSRNSQLYRATQATKSIQASSPLAAELQKKYVKKSVRAIEGDTVSVIRGEYKGIDGKIARVDTFTGRVAIEGIKKEKVRGEKYDVLVHASNLVIIDLNTSDQWRMSKITGKKAEPSVQQVHGEQYDEQVHGEQYDEQVHGEQYDEQVHGEQAYNEPKYGEQYDEPETQRDPVVGEEKHAKIIERIDTVDTVINNCIQEVEEIKRAIEGLTPDAVEDKMRIQEIKTKLGEYGLRYEEQNVSITDTRSKSEEVTRGIANYSLGPIDINRIIKEITITLEETEAAVADTNSGFEEIKKDIQRYIKTDEEKME